jgi:hypothetical protein
LKLTANIHKQEENAVTKLTNYLVLLAVLGIMITGCGNERGAIIAPDSIGSLSASIGGVAGVAGFVLPEGATLDSATFYIYVLTPSNQRSYLEQLRGRFCRRHCRFLYG